VSLGRTVAAPAIVSRWRPAWPIRPTRTPHA